MNTLKETQEFAIQQSSSFAPDKTIDDLEELSASTMILPHLGNFNLISQTPAFPLSKDNLTEKHSEI